MKVNWYLPGTGKWHLCYFGIFGDLREKETKAELNVEIQRGLFSASGFHEIVLLAPAGRRRGAHSLDGLEK